MRNLCITMIDFFFHIFLRTAGEIHHKAFISNGTGVKYLKTFQPAMLNYWLIALSWRFSPYTPLWLQQLFRSTDRLDFVTLVILDLCLVSETPPPHPTPPPRLLPISLR